ncbi:putative protein kinase-like domain superfamily [Helianthus annuus]|nr:putative protein kinase-like domain superfamily [Helianthus annuus]
MERCFLMKEFDIYSLGVVLFEMMCGRLAILKDHKDEHRTLVTLSVWLNNIIKKENLMSWCLRV